MIIFDLGQKAVRWYLFSPAGRQRGEIPLHLDSLEPLLTTLPSGMLDKYKTIGYVLANGGESLIEPVTQIAAASVEEPFSGQAIRTDGGAVFSRLVREGLERFPDTRHHILCETAFFSSMPDRARYYALPQPWRERYPLHGCSGLTHAWAYRAAGSPERMVSIHLDNQPSVAAIEQGSAVETSAGFTTLDGLPSLTGCGAIDPSIVIDLLRHGMKPAQARELLTRNSGFQVFAKGALSLVEITDREELPRRMLLNGLMKAAGSALAAMGGTGLITVASDGSAGWQPVIAGLRDGLAFLKNGKTMNTSLTALAVCREDVLFETLGSI
ncbi:MAG: hypothetical protein AB9891_09740 [Anaerolineaceae bacterium]